MKIKGNSKKSFAYGISLALIWGVLASIYLPDMPFLVGVFSGMVIMIASIATWGREI
jgi:hypothetical protein